MDGERNAGVAASFATVSIPEHAGGPYAGPSADLLRQLSETMIEAFAWVDLSGRIIDCNTLFCELIGYSKEGLLGRNYLELSAPEWHEFERDVIMPEVVANGRSRIYEKEYIRNDGKVIPVELRSALVRDTEGKPAGIWAVIRDITGRKANRAALEESERRLRDLVESAPFGAHQYQLHEDGRLEFIGFNPAADRILGMDHSPLIGKTIEEAFPIIAQSVVPDAYRRVAATGERFDIEQVVHTEEGELYGVFEVSAFQTAPDRMAAFFRDVSERKKAELALMAGEARYRTLFQSLNDAVFVNLLPENGDPGRFIEANDRATSMLGYSREELLQMSVRDITVVDAPDTVVENGRKLVRDGSLWWRGLLRAKSGAEVPVEAGNHVFEYDGQPAVLTVVRDVTERLEAEKEVRRLNAELEARVVERTAQLEAANRELEAFSYSVSHDLRSPLRAIDGFSRILKEDYGQLLDADGLDLLNRVCESADRMGELVENLLRLSRVTRAELDMREIDLSAMAHDVIAALARNEPGRQARVDIQPDMKVTSDAALTRSLLENLLGNAWKYTGRKPRAEIRMFSSAEGPETVYTVQDNGTGFDMAHAENLFSAFHRLHSSNEFTGLGIGLAIAQRIVTRHGGQIWAESEPDEGAKFHFTLG